jgi:1,2-phenylacetyl-CoA epoxidase catalytic subunit
VLEDFGVDPAVERRLPRSDRIRVVLTRPFPELHGGDDNVLRVTIEQVVEPVEGERDAYAGVLRFYELAKKQEWQVRDLPWNELPPIPEGKGSPQRKARRQDMWRSVLTQQLQADMLACEMASQLLNVAPDPEAKLYYSTMVQDESRHTEAWLKLIGDVGGIAERDPYLDELAHMTLEADTLEEKVFQMQVFYERLIISRFRLIARASRGTVLEELCNRLATDDGIHHGAGMAYERVLLQDAPKKMQRTLVDAANRLLPIFVKHALWRPKARAVIGRLMHEQDVKRLHEDVEEGIKLAQSLGLDVSDVELPSP